jgi:hypothetical protein
MYKIHKPVDTHNRSEEAEAADGKWQMAKGGAKSKTSEAASATDSPPVCLSKGYKGVQCGNISCNLLIRSEPPKIYPASGGLEQIAIFGRLKSIFRNAGGVL